MRIVNMLKARDGSRLRSSCFRYELPQGAPPDGPLDKWFVQRFKDMYPRCEFIYHPGVKRWCIYEVSIYGGVACDDKLTLRCPVKWPMDSSTGRYIKPGSWLLKWTRDPSNTYDGIIAHNDAKREQRASDKINLVQSIIRDVMVPMKNGRIIMGTGKGDPVVHKPGKPIIFDMNMRTGQTKRVA